MTYLLALLHGNPWGFIMLMFFASFGVLAVLIEVEDYCKRHPK